MKKTVLTIASLVVLASCASQKNNNVAEDTKTSTDLPSSRTIDDANYRNYVTETEEQKKQRIESMLDDSYESYQDSNNTKDIKMKNETEDQRIIKRVIVRTANYGEYNKKLNNKKHNDYMKDKRKQQSNTAKKAKVEVDKAVNDKNATQTATSNTGGKAGTYLNTTYK